MNYPEIRLVLDTTTRSIPTRLSADRVRIDYLHIDADHSYEECLADFDEYSTLMAPSYVISIHDTDMPTIARIVNELRGATHWS